MTKNDVLDASNPCDYKANNGFDTSNLITTILFLSITRCWTQQGQRRKLLFRDHGCVQHLGGLSIHRGSHIQASTEIKSNNRLIRLHKNLDPLLLQRLRRDLQAGLVGVSLYELPLLRLHDVTLQCPQLASVILAAAVL